MIIFITLSQRLCLCKRTLFAFGSNASKNDD